MFVAGHGILSYELRRKVKCILDETELMSGRDEVTRSYFIGDSCIYRI